MVRGQALHTVVIYDIASDLIRARVAAACKDFGLDPIQYSAFSGMLNVTVRKQLFARLSDTLGKAPGRILMIPVCEQDAAAMRQVINIGTAPETGE